MSWFKLADLRYGLRILLKSPGWTVLMVATFALGIGLTTAIFSLAYGILVNALPYPDPDRLMVLWNTSSSAAAAGLSRLGACSADWIDWREQSTSFEDIALTKPIANFNLTGNGQPERVQGGRTTWNLPDIIGVQPVLGRMFTEEETRRDAKVVVLSYGFWVRRFGRDPSILSQTIQLNAEPFQVIGIMPPTFRYPTRDFEVWTPLFISPDEIRSRMGFQYRSVGRLKPGVSLQQAQSDMSAIMSRLSEQYRDKNGGKDRGVLVERLLDSNVGQFRTTLNVLMGSVACLLLIACINLGGLLSVRASSRMPEFAVRAALGGSAGRLQMQMLAEILPLSIVGGGVGVLLAWWLLKILVPLLPPQLLGLDSIGLNGPVLVFASVLSLVVVLATGMLPARMASRVRLSGTLQQDSRAVAGGGRLRNALVAAQVVITLVLVFSGGLLVRSLVAVLNVNPGFSPEGVLTMQMQVTRAKYPTDSQISDYYGRLLGRVKALPGVSEAAVINMLPYSGLRTVSPVEFEGKPDDSIPVDPRWVTPGYFAAMGIPLLRGRDFSEQDKEGAPPVGIVDQQLVLTAFGGGDPLGKRLRFGAITNATPWVEIVGVVGHIRNDNLESDPRPQIYWPNAQRRAESMQTQDRGAIVVRTVGRPESFASAIVNEFHVENPDQPVYDVRSMSDWLDRSVQSRNLLTGLVTLFGGASLLLACLGLYGVVSYGAGLRLREFAIRMALGAESSDVRRLVLGHAGRLALLGSAIGLVVAFPVSRELRSVLYGVGSADLIAWVGAPVLMLLTALLAGLGPALKAGRVDPAVRLRGE